MLNVNKVILLGNVTRDPELRVTQTGQSVVNFGVATNEKWTDKSGEKKETVEFHAIVAWGKLAEMVGEYVKKGRKVYVEGKLQTKKWEDKEGKERFRTEILASQVIVVDKEKSEAPVVPQEEKPDIEDIPF